jgi:hypothetical protein
MFMNRMALYLHASQSAAQNKARQISATMGNASSIPLHVIRRFNLLLARLNKPQGLDLR